jgi:hypothetical protein
MRDQIELEESQMEEEEDEEEAEEEPVRKPIPLTDIQKDQLRLEHLRIMEERFLQGKEPSVDYVAIDDNAEVWLCSIHDRMLLLSSWSPETISTLLTLCFTLGTTHFIL